MSALIPGDRVEVVVTPYEGRDRIRQGEVFAVSGGKALVEVHAPGVPDWPYTVEVAARLTGVGPRRQLSDADGALQPGDSGAEVLALQADLYALGFGLSKTGVYDEQTRVTVEEFQKALAMVPHGFATRATRERLAELVRCNRADH